MKAKQAMNEKIAAFVSQVEKSDDLNDELQSLADHLAEFTGATACYIGKISKPIKGISQGMPVDGFDLDHLVSKAKDEIQFIHASD